MIGEFTVASKIEMLESELVLAKGRSTSFRKQRDSLYAQVQELGRLLRKCRRTPGSYVLSKFAAREIVDALKDRSVIWWRLSEVVVRGGMVLSGDAMLTWVSPISGRSDDICLSVLLDKGLPWDGPYASVREDLTRYLDGGCLADLPYERKGKACAQVLEMWSRMIETGRV